MKMFFRLAALITIFSIAGHKTESFIRTPISGSSGVPIYWNLTDPFNPNVVSNGRLIYSLNPAGSDNLPFTQVEGAIASAFQTWENVPSSRIAFTRGPNTSSTATVNDNVLQLFWLENSTTTSDGLNVAGALAISRLTTINSGPRAGEIIDAALVFNGNQFQWAVDGRDSAADVAEVATHEIGHILGLNHSLIGGSTMFPRSGIGRSRGRTLEPDDQIGVSVIYPDPGFNSSSSVIRGRVIDNAGGDIFGAHVTAVDSSGNVVAGAISQPDGGYAIQGLPTGNYTVYAEPLDPANGAYFSKFDLTLFYNNVNVDFQTSRDFTVSTSAGATATLDIQVTRGTPPFDGYFIYDAPNTGFLNISTAATQGQSNLTIGVAGPGLPLSGSPLAVSGAGVNILRTYFRTTNNGLPAVLADISVNSNAAIGARNIIISNGAQRTIMTGGLEILAGSGGPAALAVVNSARFTPDVAAESIVSAFGSNLSATSASATTNPLPTSLAGTSVRLRDSSGNERLAPLFFVSPSQINYQIAPGILIGSATITVTGGNGAVSSGTIAVQPVAPGIFSANSSGQGVASALALRIRNGAQSFEPVARFDAAQNQSVPVQIDLGPATDQVFLILFCTGVRFRSSVSAVSFNVGGVTGTPTYAGAQGGFVGLDQVNVPLSRSLIGRGLVNVTLTMDGITSNTVTVSVK